MAMSRSGPGTELVGSGWNSRGHPFLLPLQTALHTTHTHALVPVFAVHRSVHACCHGDSLSSDSTSCPVVVVVGQPGTDRAVLGL